MKKVVMVFPDTVSIIDFMLSNNVSNVEVNSIDQTITGVIAEDKIEKALNDYGAHLKTKHFA